MSIALGNDMALLPVEFIVLPRTTNLDRQWRRCVRVAARNTCSVGRPRQEIKTGKKSKSPVGEAASQPFRIDGP
jgi:hypothetical protein